MRHPASPKICIESTDCLTKERKDIVAAPYNAIGAFELLSSAADHQKSIF
jgi:hypothetical protein